MLPKFVAIPSAAIPIAVLASIGYVPNAEQTPQVVFAIKAIFALLPAFFAALAFVAALRFPINERIHARIRDGIAAHAKGQAAIDPLTGATVLPPRSRAVDEDTGWFLDHFTHRELASYLAHGSGWLLARVWFAALASLAVCGGATLLAAERVTSLDADPGAIAVLAIVTAGFALAVFFFHVIRLLQSRRLLRGEVPLSVIAAWLTSEAEVTTLAPVATDALG
jgi:hypothetical protein